MTNSSTGSAADRDTLVFAVALGGVCVIALALRILFLTADAPWNPFVGIVWHDEGAWVHNARNRALFGQWSLDGWNPMYVAPVFTALEYGSFVAFGVGVWQARLVSVVAGMASGVLGALGVRRLAGPMAGIVAGALLATNYVYVMYNRAAIMEATMVAFIVAAWYCYVRAQESPVWGAAAGVCALLSFFTKAAAAFFIAALVLEALIAAARLRPAETATGRRAGVAALAGLAGAAICAWIFFVGPNWTEYQFYNWQMSVTRKPTYTLGALIDRASWFPVLHDLFTRMWLVLLVATAGALTWLSRWRLLAPPLRLLLLWIGLGVVELIVHDVGNERRFIFFIPALIAMASIVLGGTRAFDTTDLARMPRRRALLALPVVLFAGYVLSSAAIRLMFLYEIRPVVRLATATAILLTVALYASWPAVPRWLSRERWTARAGLAVAALVCAGDVAQFAQWAAGRSYENVTASVRLGSILPPDTLVHGKLANGLALENRIRPVFVGRNFGNYADRKRRDDVRYILTYIAPCVGYEGPVINEVLEAYAERRVLMTFDVSETTTGHDRAALIDKFGGRERGSPPGPELGRACD
ncbi:MAG: ArnT family glycosyltransferase [Vicinamibacterales bacterium]